MRHGPSGRPETRARGREAIQQTLGWIQRAERLLDGLPPSPEHAFLAYQKAHVALMGQRDPVAARRLGQEAAAIARSVGPADMEMLGLALEGLAMVTGGEVAAGMSLLDEATAAATAGELTDPVVIGTACCYLIRACEQVHDYDRAAQWCERVREFCRRWKFTHLFSACRIQYASLLTLRGEWAEAEREIEALRRHVERVQPRLVPIALIRLGDLRRRQGRWEEADQLLADSGSHYLAVLGYAALALDRGENTRAVELAEEYLRRVPPEDRTERVSGLDILTRARLAEGQLDLAQGPLAELRAIANKVGTEPLQATVAHAEGCLFSAQGDHKSACWSVRGERRPVRAQPDPIRGRPRPASAGPHLPGPRPARPGGDRHSAWQGPASSGSEPPATPRPPESSSRSWTSSPMARSDPRPASAGSPPGKSKSSAWWPRG